MTKPLPGTAVCCTLNSTQAYQTHCRKVVQKSTDSSKQSTTVNMGGASGSHTRSTQRSFQHRPSHRLCATSGKPNSPTVHVALPLSVCCMLSVCLSVCCALFAGTPPGFFTADGTTQPCPDGSYRAGWSASAPSCKPCGLEVVKAAKTDFISIFSLVNNTESFLPVTTSSQDCCECAAWAGCLFNDNTILLRWLLGVYCLLTMAAQRCSACCQWVSCIGARAVGCPAPVPVSSMLAHVVSAHSDLAFSCLFFTDCTMLAAAWCRTTTHTTHRKPALPLPVHSCLCLHLCRHPARPGIVLPADDTNLSRAQL